MSESPSKITLLKRRRIYRKPTRVDEALAILMGWQNPKTLPWLCRWDSGQSPSRSFVIAFLEHLYAALAHVTYSIEDTGNTARTIGAPRDSNDSFMFVYEPDDNESGIVIGTGTAAESNTDYKLDTIINDGAGAGQMEYNNHAHETTAVVGANVDFELRRTFTNNSGNNITVNELGIYCHTNTWYFCDAREKLSAGDTIGNGETYEVVLTHRTTV